MRIYLVTPTACRCGGGGCFRVCVVRSRNRPRARARVPHQMSTIVWKRITTTSGRYYIFFLYNRAMKKKKTASGDTAHALSPRTDRPTLRIPRFARVTHSLICVVNIQDRAPSSDIFTFLHFFLNRFLIRRRGARKPIKLSRDPSVVLYFYSFAFLDTKTS